MAHFFDPKNGKPLTTLTVPQAGTFQIALYGGGPNGEDLKVTSNPNFSAAEDDPAVTGGTNIGNHVRVFTIHTAKLGSKELNALYNNNRYSEPVTISTASGPAPAPGMQFTKLDIRKSIVDLARTFVGNSHYLWGTAGNTPGQHDGNPGGGKAGIATLRAPSLNTTTADPPKVIGVCMAVQALADGYNTCAGCSRNKTADLNAYLGPAQAAQQKGADQTAWPGAGPSGLHPRKFHWKGTAQRGAQIVWGESCAGHRHFDCVGFVNYCYAYHVIHKVFALEIAQWAGNLSGAVKITDPKNVMDGDVIIKPDFSHIAMIYLDGGTAKIVQAEETEVGLTDTAEFNDSGWIRVRMMDTYLVQKKGSLG